MTVTLRGGDQFTGPDAADIVKQLKLEDWTAGSNRETYKKNMERRIREFNGQEIEYSDDLGFLMELQRIGFIQELYWRSA